MSLRTLYTETTYQYDRRENRLTPLLDEPRLREWRYWALIDNRYPHDRLADTHHMLVLKRPAANMWRINIFEWLELRRILEELNPAYDCWKVNFTGLQSIKGLPHIHLYQLKQIYK